MTNRSEQVERLITMLLDEMPTYREEAGRIPTDSFDGRRRLLRGLMNVRPALPLSSAFLSLQDELLGSERKERGVIHVDEIPVSSRDPRIALWQGDICRLDADAIVNAANSKLLGCFVPCHGCIDNAIHSAAGLELREECNAIMQAQGHDEPTGSAKLTKGYNLPCAHVIHTVGPIIQGPRETPHEKIALASCYLSCLDLAYQQGLGSIAFPCISTGEFRFPNDSAAQVAVTMVIQWLDDYDSDMRVVFNVFKDIDYDIYQRLLCSD